MNNSMSIALSTIETSMTANVNHDKINQSLATIHVLQQSTFNQYVN